MYGVARQFVSGLSLFLVAGSALAVFGGALPAEYLEWEGRIVGGQNALIQNHPHMVSLRSAANAHFCGGSIMNNRYVLTAAHCVYRRAEANTLISVATDTLDRPGRQHTVARFVIHNGYNSDTLENDIALVQTETPIILTVMSSPIELTTAITITASGAIVTGWGQRGVDDGMSNQLQMLTTNIININDCRIRFSAANAARVFNNKMCTAGPIGQGTCMGDAGGPMVFNGLLEGVLSWGIPCALGSPDVYERINIHRFWILANMT